VRPVYLISISTLLVQNDIFSVLLVN